MNARRLWVVLGWVLSLALFGVTLALALLSLGTFASLAGTGPLWLRSIGSLESTLSGALNVTGLGSIQQALALMLLTSVCAGLAAYLKPRA
ncbi:hypothetical protein GCM10008959_01540 [Deinococcus seoulensis]|uniref:ABC transporter permease n=2 Tax=Deinococcus TaxID=1298 RepID=A0ABQ2RKH8_9DEIO|nr:MULTISPECIES: hypothetical protein [Deinococcus]GGR44271.1 hypothetical protein GCM10008959_01540 [Deinococcus seoulensis]GGS23841.1 hypothetical protein GCM10008961_14200 [Deinococcus knuensis]